MIYTGSFLDIPFAQATATQSIEMQLPSRVIHIFQTGRWLQRGSRYDIKHYVPEMIHIGDEVYVNDDKQLKARRPQLA